MVSKTIEEPLSSRGKEATYLKMPHTAQKVHKSFRLNNVARLSVSILFLKLKRQSFVLY